METEAILSEMDVRVEMAELECSQCGFSSRRDSDGQMEEVLVLKGCGMLHSDNSKSMRTQKPIKNEDG